MSSESESTYKLEQMFTELIGQLRENLQKHTDPKTKVWWENYVQGSAPFMGVKMGLIRRELHQWYETQVTGRVAPDQQLDLALALFGGEYTEEKLAGTLFIQEILLPAGLVACPRDVDRFGALFDDGLIYDWNVCDWFCVKVLGPLIEKEGRACADAIAQWREAENLWRARAALVAFVPVAEDSGYYAAIAASCAVLIRREERFAKTAVGWILREISRNDETFVRQVLDQNIRHFSLESLKNATKYFSKESRVYYRELHKHSSPT
jgi:3-methyladenine DNA glycosylase AlkD